MTLVPGSGLEKAFRELEAQASSLLTTVQPDLKRCQDHGNAPFFVIPHDFPWYHQDIKHEPVVIRK